MPQKVNFVPKLVEIAQSHFGIGDSIFKKTRKKKYVEARMICALVLYKRYNYNGRDLYNFGFTSTRGHSQIWKFEQFLKSDKKFADSFTRINVAYRDHIEKEQKHRNQINPKVISIEGSIITER